MGKTIVVLGAGLAGLPMTHHILKYTAPKAKDLKVILVTPNTDFYMNIAVVRGVVPGQYTDKQLFYPIEPELKQYPKNSWELVHGVATSLDPDAHTVTVGPVEGQTSSSSSSSPRVISYDALVIATGTSMREGMPWKTTTSTPDTKARLHALQGQIAAAKSIVVAGGGPTGVEMAAELAFEYGTAKTVTLVTDKPLPMDDQWRRDVRQIMLDELAKLGAKHVGGTKVVGVTSSASANGKPDLFAEGPKTLRLRDVATGEERDMTADVYLPALGAEPNTAFLPERLLTSGGGYVRQDPDMRVPGYPDLWALGDVGSLDANLAFKTDAQVKLVGEALRQVFVDGRATTSKDPGFATYVVDTKVGGGVTLGRSRGTGQMGSWRLWSFLVWWVKGRHLGTDKASEIASGKLTAAGKL